MATPSVVQNQIKVSHKDGELDPGPTQETILGLQLTGNHSAGVLLKGLLWLPPHLKTWIRPWTPYVILALWPVNSCQWTI